MYRSKQNHADVVSMRALGISVAWIVVLLAGYWLLVDWHQLPGLAWSLVTFRH